MANTDRTEYYRQYYLANRERILIKNRRNWAENKEVRNARRREWQKVNAAAYKVGRVLGCGIVKARQLLGEEGR